MRRPQPAILFLLAACCAGCAKETPAPKKTATPAKTSSAAPNPEEHAKVHIQTEPFGETKEGLPITRYLLSNSKGMTVGIINYGGVVTSIDVPDRNGKAANVTLGFPTLAGYVGKDPYFGSICGRYANRIAKGKFKLEGKEYTLAVNDPPNHLHGGLKSFSDVVWLARTVPPANDGNSAGVELMYESKDGEEGYPSAVKVTVIYTLTDNNELRIDYRAVSDKPTVVNLTHHGYYNLKGAGARDVYDHLLTLNAAQYLPVDAGSIPTGEKKAVKGTPMDFTSPTKIGAHIQEIDGGGGFKGFDHCYVLNAGADPLKTAAARVEDPESGRVMEIFTTEPGVQFYTGNHLNGSEENGGFKQHHAFCLECQHFPDSPNRPEFPSTVLTPAKPYTQTTIHRFSTK